MTPTGLLREVFLSPRVSILAWSFWFSSCVVLQTSSQVLFGTAFIYSSMRHWLISASSFKNVQCGSFWPTLYIWVMDVKTKLDTALETGTRSFIHWKLLLHKAENGLTVATPPDLRSMHTFVFLKPRLLPLSAWSNVRRWNITWFDF